MSNKHVKFTPIHVTRTINASVGAVFDALTDHENYTTCPQVLECELEQAGTTHRNGLGALRVVTLELPSFTERQQLNKIKVPGKVILPEHIVNYIPPRKNHPIANYQYLIRNPRAVIANRSYDFPIVHERGDVTMFAQDKKRCEIRWTSCFRLQPKQIGPKGLIDILTPDMIWSIATARLVESMEANFNIFLDTKQKELEGGIYG